MTQEMESQLKRSKGRAQENPAPACAAGPETTSSDGPAGPGLERSPGRAGRASREPCAADTLKTQWKCGKHSQQTKQLETPRKTTIQKM